MVLSHAVAVGIALYGGVQRFRVTSGKPGRRRTGGGTENNLDSCFLCLIQETVKESKIINTLPGLKEIPGKLSHSGSFQAKLFHELEIFFPVGFSPMLRIIAGAQRDFFQVHTPFHNFSPSAPLGLHILFFQPSNIFTAA